MRECGGAFFDGLDRADDRLRGQGQRREDQFRGVRGGDNKGISPSLIERYRFLNKIRSFD